jgi:tRNA(Ile)-lysidine synthase
VRETENLMAYLINDIREKSFTKFDNYICFDINKIDKNILNQTLLFELLRPFGFNSSQIADIHASFNKSGLTFQSNEYDLFIDRMQIFIRSNADKTNNKINFIIDKLPFTFEKYGTCYSFELIDRNEISDKDIRTNTSQFINFDLLELPLNIRQPEIGEKFSPFGLKGSKKISDFLTDKKINFLQKQQLLGIYHLDLIGLLGLEIDNKFAIKNNTKKILRIERT